MDNLPFTRASLIALVALILCITSLLICEVIDPLVTFADNDFCSLSEEYLQPSHLDEHDDDFVLAGRMIEDDTSTAMGIVLFPQILVTNSSPAPLLPPPKAI